MTDLARLRLLAAAATPGPWAVNDCRGMDGGAECWQETPHQDVYVPESPGATFGTGVVDINGGDPETVANATYIAAFNPTTAAALLDEVESWAAWIVRADDAKHSTDWACAECVAQAQGHPDSVVAGFRCVPHRARAALLEAEPLDPEGAPR